jgi:cytochrome b
MEHDIQIENGSIKVWDLPVRLFHWLQVFGFTLAYLTAEYHFKEWHVVLGYALCGLVGARIFWGFFGTQYARFNSFIFSVSETLAYLRSLRAGKPHHYFGHNPAGALMVFALLLLLLAIFLSGLVTLSVIDFEGPFLALANFVDDETSYTWRHIHEILSNVALVLIPLHILGVIAGCIQHKENLVRAMFTGKKQIPETAPNNMKPGSDD